MPGQYTVGVKTVTTAITTTARTQIALIQAATGMRRPELQEFSFGQADVPNATDCDVLWDLIRVSAAGAGTGTAITAANTPRNDPADADPVCTVAHSYSAEPTTVDAAALFSLAINQRGAWRFVAAGPGRGFTIAATASLKLLLRALSPNYASFSSAQLAWAE